MNRRKRRERGIKAAKGKQAREAKEPKKSAEQAQERADGWVNTLLGIGSATTDRRLSGYHSASAEPSYAQYESLYNEDGMAARIVESIPFAALRQGFELITSSEMEPEVKARAEATLWERWASLDATKAMFRASVWGRLFGGGAVFIANTDSDWAEPLDWAKGAPIVHLQVYDRHEMSPLTRYSDPYSPLFGQIEKYRITPSDNLGQSFEVHASRLLMFGGAPTTRRERARLGYWDNSVLRRVYAELRDDGIVWASVNNVLVDSSIGVLKVNNFWDITAGRMKEQFAERLEIMNMGRTSARALPIDTEEDFAFSERTFSGLSDVLDRKMMRISSLTGMPITVLYGRSPAGLSATGESDIRQWYDQVEAQRNQTYREAIEALLLVIAYEQSVEDPESWDISWPSLWQETAQELADRKSVIAGVDTQYIDTGVLTSDEVALARYGSGEWSDAAPQLDLSVRGQGESDEQG